MTSPSTRLEDAVSEFSDDVSASSLYGRTEPDNVGMPFPGSSGELMVAKSVGAGGSIGGSHTPKNPLTTSLVVKALPGITGMMFSSLKI